ncbi:MAG: hypothetical protein Q8R28_03460 [Dehalococcoidia bacterium]|nr:hypothetical protein [Dehalococcoidia bacterium]
MIRGNVIHAVFMVVDGQQVMLDVGGDWAGLEVRVEGVAFREAMVE